MFGLSHAPFLAKLITSGEFGELAGLLCLPISMQLT